jgi:hypothetical protein
MKSGRQGERRTEFSTTLTASGSSPQQSICTDHVDCQKLTTIFDSTVGGDIRPTHEIRKAVALKIHLLTMRGYGMEREFVKALQHLSAQKTTAF